MSSILAERSPSVANTTADPPDNDTLASEHARAASLRAFMTSEEDERRRLSRELHDLVGNHVIALTLALHQLRLRVVGPIDGLFTHMEETVAALDCDMHRMARNFRPWVLDLGLIAAITAHVERWSQQTGIRGDFGNSQDQEPCLSTEIETILFRIMQEALTNVARHARATHASIVVARRPTCVLLIVEDNGRGFDPGDLGTSASLDDRIPLGMIGMRERAGMFGGTVTFESGSEGTSVFVCIPTDSV